MKRENIDRINWMDRMEKIMCGGHYDDQTEDHNQDMNTAGGGNTPRAHRTRGEKAPPRGYETALELVKMSTDITAQELEWWVR